MHVQKTFELSERRACRAVGQPRSTQRYYVGRRTEGDRPLLERLLALSEENPRCSLLAQGCLRCASTSQHPLAPRPCGEEDWLSPEARRAGLATALGR